MPYLMDSVPYSMTCIHMFIFYVYVLIGHSGNGDLSLSLSSVSFSMDDLLQVRTNGIAVIVIRLGRRNMLDARRCARLLIQFIGEQYALLSGW